MPSGRRAFHDLMFFTATFVTIIQQRIKALHPNALRIYREILSKLGRYGLVSLNLPVSMNFFQSVAACIMNDCVRT